MTQLRFALIGLGYWGPNYARILGGELPEAALVAVADFDPHKLEAVSRRFPGVRTTCDTNQLMRADDVDAVIVATPAHRHGSLAEAALRAGKHVIVEKPMADRSDVARAMIATAAGAQRTLMVAHTFLFSPAVRFIKEFIDAGRLGHLQYVSSQRTGLGPVRADVNALWDLAPHDLSMLHHWIGQMPVDVHASGASYLNGDNEDAVFLTLQFPNRVLAGVQLSWLDPVKTRRTTVVGTKKMLVFDDTHPTEKARVYDNTTSYQKTGADFSEFVASVRAGDVTIPRLTPDEPLKVQVRHFVACVAGRPPAAHGRPRRAVRGRGAGARPGGA